MSPTRRRLTVTALLLSMFMAAMEATVVGTAMPTVIADLGGIALYGWVGSAYLLASTVSVPVYGKLADLYGRKPLMLFGIALFLLGSLASGAAGAIVPLIAARAVQGLGAGAMQPIAVTVVGDLFTVEERGRVQGLFGAVWGIAGVAGPLLGGAIVQALSWRWVFWVNVPFGLASAGLLALSFREAQRPARTLPLDWPGAALLTLASLALLLGAAGEHPALSAPLALALLAGVAWRGRTAPDPVLPLALVVRRPIAVAALSSLLLGATMMGVLMFVPLYVQGVLGGSPAEAGATAAPMLVGWPIAATLTSRALVRVGFRAPVWLGSGLCAIALTAFAVLLAPDAHVGSLQVVMFVYGLGMGFVNTTLLIAVQASVGWEQRGVATATTMFSRSIGGALGVGAFGSLLAARLGALLPADAVRGLLDPTRRGAVAGGAQMPAALAEGLAPIFWGTAALSLLNLGVVLLYPARLAGPTSKAAVRDGSAATAAVGAEL